MIDWVSRNELQEQRLDFRGREGIEHVFLQRLEVPQLTSSSWATPPIPPSRDCIKTLKISPNVSCRLFLPIDFRTQRKFPLNYAMV